METQNRDAMFAWSLALMLIGEHGRAKAEGVFAAEHASMTVVLHKARVPMLLTIDAPGRVLEIETDDLEGTHARVLSHNPGPWQHKLFKAMKHRVPWSDRSWLARPLKRKRSWPFGQIA
jgi:hypothetical protein